MESIIVQIILGSNGAAVEFMLPAHVPVSSLMEDIARLCEAMHPQVTFDPEGVVLIDVQSGQTLPMDWTLGQCRVEDGGQLMLV